MATNVNMGNSRLKRNVKGVLTINKGFPEGRTK